MLTMTWATISVLGLALLIGSINAASHPKIIGGKTASIKNYPYLVSIRVYGDHNCGGAIISDRHILTAAHCTVFETENSLTVHSGISTTDKKGDVHKVLSIHSHPKFHMFDRENPGNDIAILTLKDPIVFNKYQQKVNLPNHDIGSYQVAHVVGWGRTSKDSYVSAKHLQKLQVVLVPIDQCVPLLTHKINEKDLCAFRSDTTGACHGDSGGPLVSRGEVVGVVSRGDSPICANGVPDIYTNVFAYKDFIESVMNE